METLCAGKGIPPMRPSGTERQKTNGPGKLSVPLRPSVPCRSLHALLLVVFHLKPSAKILNKVYGCIDEVTLTMAFSIYISNYTIN